MTTRPKTNPEDLPPLCRRRHLYGLGLSKAEVAKMVDAGVLTEKRTRRNQRAYFDRSEILQVIYGQRND